VRRHSVTIIKNPIIIAIITEFRNIFWKRSSFSLFGTHREHCRKEEGADCLLSLNNDVRQQINGCNPSVCLCVQEVVNDCVFPLKQSFCCGLLTKHKQHSSPTRPHSINSIILMSLGPSPHLVGFHLYRVSTAAGLSCWYILRSANISSMYSRQNI